MKKHVAISLALFVCLQLANAQTTTSTPQCSDSNTTITASARVVLSDATEHDSSLGSLHAFGLQPQAKCIYTHANTANCNTECDVVNVGATFIDPMGGTLLIERGPLTSPGTHQVAGGYNAGFAAGANSGASCSLTMAAGAANCLAVMGVCLPTISVSQGGATMTTGGTKVWFSGPVPAPNNCPAVPDPQATPTPSPTPKPVAGGGLPPDPCLNSVTAGPTGEFGHQGGNAPDCSPILIDITGGGFTLTDAAHGVPFDWTGSGTLIQSGWTANANNAFLALDLNNNGTINSGRELFGNFTPQPQSDHPNGFAALAVYDDPASGGNGDGIIDPRDKIFSSLRLWIDANHDGICQPGELYPLPELGVFNISLDYELSRRTDQYGNAFRYRARVNVGVHGDADKVGRTAYDVFFVDK